VGREERTNKGNVEKLALTESGGRELADLDVVACGEGGREGAEGGRDEREEERREGGRKGGKED